MFTVPRTLYEHAKTKKRTRTHETIDYVPVFSMFFLNTHLFRRMTNGFICRYTITMAYCVCQCGMLCDMAANRHGVATLSVWTRRASLAVDHSGFEVHELWYSIHNSCDSYHTDFDTFFETIQLYSVEITPLIVMRRSSW